MKFSRLVFSALLLASPSIAFSQTTPREIAVIEAALDVSFNHMLPYVRNWVVSQQTEPVPLGHAHDMNMERARADYTARNAGSLSLASLRLRKVTTADIASFTESGQFNWAAFEDRFGGDTWTARIPRRGFTEIVTKQENGEWKTTGGIVPAVEKSE